MIGSPVGSMHMRCKLQQLKNGSIENENPTDAELKKILTFSSFIHLISYRKKSKENRCEKRDRLSEK